MTQQKFFADLLTFAAEPLDRAALARGQKEHIHTLLVGGKARIVPVWNQRHLVSPEPRALAFSLNQAAPFIERESCPLIFLGMESGEPWFALGLPVSDAPPELDVAGDFVILNDVVTMLPAREATILAYARAMVIWHFNHLHCGRCGAATKISDSGHSRVCTNTSCKHRSFPRTDPAVITLVTDGPRCLLGRQAQWPAGVYSTIAGFVEPGETLEQTVYREVREETGIEVDEIQYLASQPWPFPSSIMLGFRAKALTTEIRCEDDELEDCRWFTRAELKSFRDRTDAGPGFKLPNRYSIARFLIEEWMSEA